MYISGKWTYTSPTPLTDLTIIALKAANANAINVLKGLQFFNTSATATIIQVRDGTTPIWRGLAAANGTHPIIVNFDIPLMGTINTALNFAAETTGANLYINAQGYEDSSVTVT